MSRCHHFDNLDNLVWSLGKEEDPHSPKHLKRSPTLNETDGLNTYLITCLSLAIEEKSHTSFRDKNCCSLWLHLGQ